MTVPLELSHDLRHEILERKSRFITQLTPAFSIEDADEALAKARAEFPDARHHCSATVIAETAHTGPVHRSNDDGEPSGTAGMPMLQALTGAGLANVSAVVIRYFGGVKLGASGLTRTYARAVTEAIDHARKGGVLVQIHHGRSVEIAARLAEVGSVENQLRTWVSRFDGASVQETCYAPNIATIKAVIPAHATEELDQAVAAWTSGTATVRAVGEAAIRVPLEPSASAEPAS